MTVAMNMAAIMRLENPLRLSSFIDQVLIQSRKEETDIKITTDAAKSTTNTPVIELVDQLYRTSI